MPGITKSLYRESTPATKSNYRESPKKAAQETRFLVPGALERVLVKKSSAESKAVIPSILLKPSPREKKGSIQVNNAYETLGIAYPETPGQRSNYRASPGQRSNYRESPIDHRSNYRESPGQRSDYRKPFGPGSNIGGSKDKYHDGTSQSQSPSNSKERRDDKSHYGSRSSFRQSSHNNDSGLQSGYHSPRSNRPPSNYGSSGRDSYYQQRDDKGCCGCSRCVCISIICAVVLMLAIVAVLVVVFWYFLFSVHATSTTISTISTAKPMEDKAYSFRDGVCMGSDTMKRARSKECVAGSPPKEDSCNTKSTCTSYVYGVLKSGGTYILTPEVLQPVPLPPPPTSINQSRLLCLMKNGEFGMCEERECSLPYNGVDLKDWKEEEKGWNQSNWTDNCDKPNPCWNNESLIEEYASKDMMTRDKCFSPSTEIVCPNTEGHVGLWVQHRRCNMGKYGATKKGCDGLPIRYWNCGKCNNRRGYPTGCTPSASSCEYTCGGNPTTTRTAKNGVNCEVTTGVRGYCVHGECHEVTTVRDEERTAGIPKENCKKNL